MAEKSLAGRVRSAVTGAAEQVASRVPGSGKPPYAPPPADVDRPNGTPAAAAGPGGSGLPVRDGEAPWTEAEIASVREELAGELETLGRELASLQADLDALMVENLDLAGDDQADAGSKSNERDQEMSLLISVKEMRDQVLHAIKRLDAGDYGLCEACGQPIGKLRLQAFPRAALCLSCKQKQERR
jgi:DnaK suppressor protein